ncbi:uncharacterized protein FIBRA_03542 [Fibroporia radiculosa]|uniref:Ribonuclease H2 subunit B n=1 Tax=Fibroporia radiculosa TaxID=599839 RepID=J4G5T8_9APHY|nr:uncharacterized protein FIBRA_03542 [Fibroporia radiculosa]CCM01488.1 predicted protein [Fibroporia radiculosa]
MSSRVIVLPDDILHTVTDRVNEKVDETVENDPHFLRLPHPRTGIPALFVIHDCQHRSKPSILEVQTISPPNARSWFMPEGQIVDDGQLFLMTPIDPAFLLIAILNSCTESAENFRPAEDLLEDATIRTFGSWDTNKLHDQSMMHGIHALITFTGTHQAMRRICEVKEVTADITVFRYSPRKVLDYLRTKVARLAKPDICEKSRTLVRIMAKDGIMEDGKEHLLESARTRAACELISQYIPEDIFTTLLESYDFAELDTHLQMMRDDLAAQAAHDSNETKTRKGKASKAANNDADKKRKAQTKASNGVEKLKKVNVKGMAKISSFFQKPTN